MVLTAILLHVQYQRYEKWWEEGEKEGIQRRKTRSGREEDEDLGGDEGDGRKTLTSLFHGGKGTLYAEGGRRYGGGGTEKRRRGEKGEFEGDRGERER
jgi:hypothetical protein